MPSTHTPPSKSAVDEKLVVVGAITSDNTFAEAVKETAHSNHAITADDKSSPTGISDAGPSTAHGAKEPLSTTEQKLLDELHKIINTFGPLERVVKIKLPKIKKQISIHGRLLIGKSIFCRSMLIKIAKEGGPRMLKLPTESVAIVAYFLKWVYNDDILSTLGGRCSSCAEHSITWPDLVNLWVFAKKMTIPELQNHAIDILVRKIHGSPEPSNLNGEEADQRRAAVNLLWPGKHQARNLLKDGEALGPLRRLMMDWFANPMYQTKAEANQLWAGGISRSFYRDYALYSIQKNFSMGDCDLDDEDFGEQLEMIRDGEDVVDMIEEVAQHTLRCHWKIKPEKYYVDDNP